MGPYLDEYRLADVDPHPLDVPGQAADGLAECVEDDVASPGWVNVETDGLEAGQQDGDSARRAGEQAERRNQNSACNDVTASRRLAGL